MSAPERYSRRPLRAQEMLLATTSRGTQCLSELSVAQVIHTMGFVETSTCFCSSRVATNPSNQASQYTWNRCEPSVTESQVEDP